MKLIHPDVRINEETNEIEVRCGSKLDSLCIAEGGRIASSYPHLTREEQVKKLNDFIMKYIKEVDPR